MKRAAAAGPLLAVLVAGCSSSLDSVVGDSVWITPHKYQYHDCKQLLALETANKKRQKDLEELMAKAAQGPGGAMIGTLAYRTEYQQNVGEEKAVVHSIGVKRCRTDRESVSAQSVF